MEIRRLYKSDIPQAKELWKLCFGDSDAFVDNYFENKFELCDSLALFDGEKLAGDITMQKMDMFLWGKKHKIAFLAGCATHPDYRYKGIMRTLLCEYMKILNGEGIYICCLHPFLHAFYRKFGFETISHMKIFKAQINGSDFKSEELTPQILLEKYTHYVSKYNSYFVRDTKKCENKLRELFCDGGRAYFDGENYVLYYEESGKISALEHNISTKSELLKVLNNFPEKGEIEIPLPQNFDEGILSEFTMMRIVNAQKFIENIKCDNFENEFTISDDFCPWNEKKYILEENCGNFAKKTVKNYDIRDFAKKIFESKNPIYFDTY